MLNHLSNLIFHRRGSIRPWALPSAGYVTCGSQWPSSLEQGWWWRLEIVVKIVEVMHAECIKQCWAPSERSMNVFYHFLFFTWLPRHNSYFLTIHWPLLPLSPLQLITHPNSFLLSKSKSTVTPPEKLFLVPIPPAPNMGLFDPLSYSHTTLPALPLEHLLCQCFLSLAVIQAPTCSFPGTTPSEWLAFCTLGGTMPEMLVHQVSQHLSLFSEICPLSPAIILCSVTPCPCCPL